MTESIQYKFRNQNSVGPILNLEESKQHMLLLKQIKKINEM